MSPRPRIDDCLIDDRPIGGGETFMDLHIRDLRNFESGIIGLLRDLGVENPIVAEEKTKPVRGEFTAPQGSPFNAITALEELGRLEMGSEVSFSTLATMFGGNTVRDLSTLGLIISRRRGMWRLKDQFEDAKLALAMAISQVPAFQVAVGELKKDINTNGLSLGRKVAEYLGRDWTDTSCTRNGGAYKKWVLNLYPNFRLPGKSEGSYLSARAITMRSSKRGRASLFTNDVLLIISSMKKKGMNVSQMARELQISPNAIHNWKRANPEIWDGL